MPSLLGSHLKGPLIPSLPAKPFLPSKGPGCCPSPSSNALRGPCLRTMWRGHHTCLRGSCCASEPTYVLRVTSTIPPRPHEEPRYEAWILPEGHCGSKRGNRPELPQAFQFLPLQTQLLFAMEALSPSFWKLSCGGIMECFAMEFGNSYIGHFSCQGLGSPSLQTSVLLCSSLETGSSHPNTTGKECPASEREVMWSLSAETWSEDHDNCSAGKFLPPQEKWLLSPG